MHTSGPECATNVDPNSEPTLVTKPILQLQVQSNISQRIELNWLNDKDSAPQMCLLYGFGLRPVCPSSVLSPPPISSAFPSFGSSSGRPLIPPVSQLRASSIHRFQNQEWKSTFQWEMLLNLEMSFMILCRIILLVTNLAMFDWLFVRKKLWKYVLCQIVSAHPCVLELHLPHHHLQAQPPARHCSYSRRWHGSVKKTWERIKQHDNFRCKRCSLEQRISRFAHPGVDGQQWRRSWQCVHPPRVHPFEVFTKALCLFFSYFFFLFSKMKILAHVYYYMPLPCTPLQGIHKNCRGAVIPFSLPCWYLRLNLNNNMSAQHSKWDKTVRDSILNKTCQGSADDEITFWDWIFNKIC